jgi:hypothetical protein
MRNYRAKCAQMTVMRQRNHAKRVKTEVERPECKNLKRITQEPGIYGGES